MTENLARLSNELAEMNKRLVSTNQNAQQVELEK
jgi:hypothetical protein